MWLFDSPGNSVIRVYTALQWFLLENPDAGDVIKNTGGARKLRWRKKGQGKRGGFRTIYFYHSVENTFWMLTIYSKRDKEDLSETDKKIAAKLIEEIKK